MSFVLHPPAGRRAARSARPLATLTLTCMASALIASGALAAVDCARPPGGAVRLQDALEQLAACNPAVLAARQAIAASRADLLTADRAPNPNLTVGSATINPQAGIGAGWVTRKQIDWQARIDQPLERGNKRALRATAARAAIDVAGWQAQDVLRQQKLTLALAWIDLWSAQEQVRIATELLTLYQRADAAAQIRLRAGDIATNDVTRIAVDTQRAAGDLQRATADVMQARFALGRVLGLGAEVSNLNLAEGWPTATVLPTPVAADAANRPDLQAARAQLKVAGDGRALARALRQRDLSVGVQVDRYAPPTGTGNSFSLSLSVPLFTGHTHEGEIARAEADYTAALLAVQRLAAQAHQEQQRLTEERAAAAARVERLRTGSLPLAEKLVANADLAYRRGAAGVLDLLDALRQLRQMQAELLTAQTDFSRADAGLRAAALSQDPARDSVFGVTAALP